MDEFITNNFIFVPGYNQEGYTFHYMKGIDVDYLKENLNKDEIKKIVGFNNLGHVKYFISNLTKNNIIEGIYIKKSFYYSNVDKIKVKETELCQIMKSSDKSLLYNFKDNKPIHAYTPIYYNLFKTIRNYDIKMAEITIFKSESIEEWFNFFQRGSIYMFNVNKESINIFLNKYPDTILDMLETNEDNIENTLEKYKYFDIIIDNSTHLFNDQVNIINNCSKFTKKFLIIENINLVNTNEEFINNMNSYVKKNFTYYFISPYIDDMVYEEFNNKMLIMERKLVDELAFTYLE